MFREDDEVKRGKGERVCLKKLEERNWLFLHVLFRVRIMENGRKVEGHIHLCMIREGVWVPIGKGWIICRARS